MVHRHFRIQSKPVFTNAFKADPHRRIEEIPRFLSFSLPSFSFRSVPLLEMPNTTKLMTIFEREIDTSKGPFFTTIPLPSASQPFSLSFSELPCKCAPTMVCIPIVATLELNWVGFIGKPLEISKGSLSFERNGGSKRDKVSVGIKPGMFPDSQEGCIKANSFVTSGREKLVTIRLELEVVIQEEPTALTRSLGQFSYLL